MKPLAPVMNTDPGMSDCSTAPPLLGTRPSGHGLFSTCGSARTGSVRAGGAELLVADRVGVDVGIDLDVEHRGQTRGPGPLDRRGELVQGRDVLAVAAQRPCQRQRRAEITLAMPTVPRAMISASSPARRASA